MSSRRRRSLLSPGPRVPGGTAPRELAPAEPEDLASEGVEAPLTPAPAPELPEDGPTEVIEDSPTEVVVGGAPEDDEALREDDAPLIGNEIVVPPGDQADDAWATTPEATSHLHAPSWSSEAAEPAAHVGPLVIFEDEVDAGPDPEPEVFDQDDEPSAWAEDEVPPGFDPAAAHSLRGHTPEPARARQTRAPDPESAFFAEGEDPPTEEAPGPIPDDLANLYRAPMNVPEPPPLPGILDRFTPAPNRRQSSARPADRRSEFVPSPAAPGAAPEVVPPKGLWDETPMPADTRPGDETPPAVPWRSDRQEDDAPPFWKDPMFLAAGVVAALAGLLVVAAAWFLLPSLLAPEPEPPRPATIAPVSPRVPPPPSAVIPEDPAVPADPAGSVIPTPPELVPPLPGPRPAGPGPTGPSAAPGPRPKPPPTASNPDKDDTPASRKGTLRVRAAKNVLISIDGQPYQMTPFDLDKPAGKYVLSAIIDGQRREERVDLAAGTIRLVEF